MGNGEQRSGLPQGLVTFLMTDIEGSTRMLHRVGDRWPGLLAQSQSIIVDAVVDAGGAVWRVGGDEVCASFVSAADALTGAACAQQRLASHSWPDGDEIRVRIGVHRGAAARHGDDYVSLALHHAARIRDAGHGGQTVASSEVVASAATEGRLVGPTRPLGVYRLRDVEWPIRLVQVGAAHRFPSLRYALPVTVLPKWTTSLVGRDADIGRVGKALAASRLTSIVGPGGVGKTRVAVATAEAEEHRWADGASFCGLGDATQGDDVAMITATSLGIEPGVHPTNAVVDHLARLEALVILDNCEHVMEASAALVGDILAFCPKVSVLVTSRGALGVQGESVVELRPLPVPDEDASLDEIAASPSIALLRDRAISAFPDVDFGPDELFLAAGLCRALDGLPLAMELAAARLDVFGLADVAVTVLDGAIPPAESGSPGRQASLPAVIAWSVGRLPSQARIVLRRLSVLTGSFDLATAETIAGFGQVAPGDVSGAVVSLVATSLMERARSTAPGRAEYRLLAPVRSYGARQLQDEGERDEVYDRLFSCLDELLRSAGIQSLGAVLKRLWSTMTAAIEWAALHRPAAAAALVLLVGGEASDVGLWTPLLHWLEVAAAEAAALPPSLLGRIIAGQADLAAATLQHDRLAGLRDQLVAVVDRVPDDVELRSAYASVEAAVAGANADWPALRQARDTALQLSRSVSAVDALVDILASDAADGLLLTTEQRLEAVNEIRALGADRVRPGILAFCDVVEATLTVDADFDTALATLERLASDPTTPARTRGEAMIELCAVLADRGQWQDAVVAADRAYRWALARGDVEQQVRAQDRSAAALAVPGHFEEAYRRREDIVDVVFRRMRWGAAGLMLGMAEHAALAARPDLGWAALARWSEARPYAPDDEDARMHLIAAQLAALEDDFDAAEVHLRDAVALATGDDKAIPLAALAWVIAGQGRSAEAAEAIHVLADQQAVAGTTFAALEYAAAALATACPERRPAAQRAVGIAADVRADHSRVIGPAEADRLTAAGLISVPTGTAGRIPDLRAAWGDLRSATGSR